jgi:DNA-binding phage protein
VATRGKYALEHIFVSDDVKIPAGILARLRKAADQREMTHGDIAQKSGVPIGTVQKLMRGATDPQFMTMLKVVSALGQSLDYVVLGIGDESGDWETNLPSTRIGEKRVPIRDVSASAGHGLEVFREDPKRWMTFSLEWLMTLGNPDAMEIITVEGDSMEPELRDADHVMIDRSQRQTKDGLFVLLVDDRLFLKRVRVLGRSKVELVSTNINYPPFEVTIPDEDDEFAQDGAAVVGKVVWSGRNH